VLLLAAVVAAAAGDVAQSGSPRIAIRDGVATIRVTVREPGATLAPGTFEALDANPADGSVAVAVAGTSAPAARSTALGVRVSVTRSGAIAARTTVGRFKYLRLSGSSTAHGVVLVLWRRAPARGAAVRHGAQDCLTLETWRATRDAVTAAGRESGVFEHMFQLRVRDANGDLVGKTRVTAASGRWRATVRPRVSVAQLGMLEAYDRGASDGAVGMCLAQVPVRLVP
jgi:hypothetical protein